MLSAIWDYVCFEAANCLRVEINLIRDVCSSRTHTDLHRDRAHSNTWDAVARSQYRHASTEADVVSNTQEE